MTALIGWIRTHYILLAWLVAVFATLGSLVLSEILQLTPCELCWYQRIAMFPLVAILGVGYYRKDKRVSNYAWPLVIIGGLIALYHSLLQWGVIQQLPICSLESDCATAQIKWLGFLTIPFGSFLAFAAIAKLLLIGEGKIFRSIK